MALGRRRRVGSVGRIGAVGTRRFGPRSRSGSSRRTSTSSSRRVEEVRRTVTPSIEPPKPIEPEIDLNEIESGIATPNLTEEDFNNGLKDIVEKEEVTPNKPTKPIEPEDEEGSLDIEGDIVKPILPEENLAYVLLDDEDEEDDLLSRMLRKR